MSWLGAGLRDCLRRRTWRRSNLRSRGSIEISATRNEPGPLGILVHNHPLLRVTLDRVPLLRVGLLWVALLDPGSKLVHL